MKKTGLLVLIVLVVILSAAFISIPASAAVNRNNVAHLSGSEEVLPVDTSAVGQAIFKLSKDGPELSYKLIVANIEDVIAAHIHMAPAGQNGAVIVPLYTGGLIPGRFNGILAEGTIDTSSYPGLVEAMMAGNTYVNVHTTQHPGGEIRGQIK